MRFIFVAAILVISMMASCIEDDPLAAASISKESMITILAEMHLAEGMFLTESKPARDSIAQIYIPLILKKHGTTLDDFNRNFDLYLSVPRISNTIFSEVKTRINEITEGASAQ